MKNVNSKYLVYVVLTKINQYFWLNFYYFFIEILHRYQENNLRGNKRREALIGSKSSPKSPFEFLLKSSRKSSWKSSRKSSIKSSRKSSQKSSPRSPQRFIPFDRIINLPSKPKEKDPNNEWLYGFEWDEEIERVNRNIFKNKEFRIKQREIINATKSKRDVIALIPTGGGKSLTFQLSAVTEKGTTIVIMPLLSLINDQVMQMQDLNIKWKFIQDNKDIDEMFKEAGMKELPTKMIFMTPEKINQNEKAKSLLNTLYMNKKIERFVIDEVHWVSSWGQDFRPDYLKLSFLKDKYPSVAILGLTATATVQVKQDIINLLKLKNVVDLKCSFNRPNLFYEVRRLNKADWEEDIARVCKSYSEKGK